MKKELKIKTVNDFTPKERDEFIKILKAEIARAKKTAAGRARLRRAGFAVK